MWIGTHAWVNIIGIRAVICVAVQIEIKHLYKNWIQKEGAATLSVRKHNEQL